MGLYQAVTDLLRQVANTLQPQHGGTGSTYGEQRVVVKAINSTGSNIKLYSLVEPTFGANDLRVTQVTTAGSQKVLGAVVGYYGGDGVLIESDAPDGYETAVQTAGVARILIGSNVTRGQFAFSSTTAGQIVSSAVGSGSIGVVLDSMASATGSNARVVMSSVGSVSAGGGWDVVITKIADEDVSSSTTLQNDNELFTTTVNNGFYQFEAHIFMASPVGGSAPDIKFSFGEDNTFRGYLFRIAGNSATGTAEILIGSVQQNQPLTAQTGTTPFGIYVNGSFTAGGGTFRLQWAQNGSNVNATRVYAGSTLKVKRLA